MHIHDLLILRTAVKSLKENENACRTFKMLNHSLLNIKSQMLCVLLGWGAGGGGGPERAF